MRCLVRTGLALFGLALATPAAHADSRCTVCEQNAMPSSQTVYPISSGYVQGPAPSMQTVYPAGAACVQPPVASAQGGGNYWVLAPNQPNGAAQGVAQRNGLFGWPKKCPICDRQLVASAGVTPNAPMGVATAPGGVAPPQMTLWSEKSIKTSLASNGNASQNAPSGFAVASDAAPGRSLAFMPSYPGEPVPVDSSMAPRGTAVARRSAPYDRSVLPTSVPPAQTPLDPHEHSRLHLIPRVLGLTAIGRQHREDRDRMSREKHASIAYEPQASPIADLPMSVVYSRRMAKQAPVPARGTPGATAPAQ